VNIVHKDQSVLNKNAETCSVYEYPMNDADINGAVAHIKGRYPIKGLAVNEKCKEMAYVIRGSGKLVVDNQETNLQAGDVIAISSSEKYYWEGELVLFLSCTPAWYPEQHKNVSE
jgi:mannose-6-phosphate isomerase-like protein (cupin superfamily)